MGSATQLLACEAPRRSGRGRRGQTRAMTRAMTRAVATIPLRPAHRLLWLRVLAVNVAILVAAVLALVLTPATVSASPRASEVAVLAVGLVVTAVANAFVVRSMVRPLDELAARLDREGALGTAGRLTVEGDGIAARLSRAVNDLLERLEEGRRQAGVAALAAQESERARIAQELHDGVGQSLTVILLEAGALAGRSHVDPTELDRIRELARTSLDEVRGVARQLRPHVLEDLGLRSALSALTTELFGHGDTHVRRGIAPGLPDLEEATELVVFRVAQEALTNVARHAAAATVEVRLARVGDRVELVVADDGVGIPRAADGTGLRGMRERAAIIGADLAVGPSDTGGTVVRLQVPVTRAVPQEARS